MTSPPDANLPDLQAAFPLERWAWLRCNVRAELERRPQASTITLTLTDTSAEQRHTIRWLLQLTDVPAGRLKINIGRLDRALVHRTDAKLATRELLTALDGTLSNHPQERANARQATAQVWANAEAHPLLQHNPRLRSWLRTERDRGSLPAAPEQREALLHDTLTVLSQLPGSEGSALAQLAAQALGRAHALDPGPVAGLVLRALAHLQGSQPPISGEQNRMIWAQAGIRTDNVSSRVTVYGFRPTGNSTLATILNLATREATPLVLTLQQIERHLADSPTPLTESGMVVSICENVTVIAEAAHRLGPSCAPIVCVEGRPHLAAIQLLRHLHHHGARLRYHGDFDWDGIAIADQIMSLGATPWRMSAQDYETELENRRHTAELPPTAARTAPWSPGLVEAMSRRQRQLEEEHLLDLLIADLRTTSPIE